MDDVVSPTNGQDHPLLRRRSSVPAAPPKLILLPHRSSSSTTTTGTFSSSSDDLELLVIKPASYSYTSLKDLLPAAAVNSPKPSQVLQSDSDICIRNRLVKQAAWAYLQPMSSSPGAAGDGFCQRVAAFFDLLRRSVIRILNWTLQIFPGLR
ncbi:uncharacterized protein LOC127264206 [Andrographis paniculata]|uniref:uncharacterized protein LOC127264206 n=1 Tax=Andrographis paniculata TaxID=175694 RepID=UPI0021E787DB|nr:uncharacterized protein LOC127264206 [Andrographis paniculata]